MSEETIDISHESEAKINIHFNRILSSVGLRLEDLEGKRILDSGSGKRYLERGARLSGIGTSIVSFDKDTVTLKENGMPIGTATVGNAFDPLPFKDGSFDLIVNVGGPIQGGPYSDLSFHLYREALRVLKPQAELRTRFPLMRGGVYPILYYNNKEGNIQIPKESVEKYLRFNENVATDDQGIPDEFEDFWLDVYKDFLSKDEQISLQNFLRDELQESLTHNGLFASIQLQEIENAEKTESYNPFMILKKTG